MESDGHGYTIKPYIPLPDNSKQYLKPGTLSKGTSESRCISNVIQESIHQWIENKKRVRVGSDTYNVQWNHALT